MNENLRDVYLIDGEKETKVLMKELKKGDIFRMEEDGVPFNNGTHYISTCDAFVCSGTLSTTDPKDWIWGVNVDLVDKNVKI